MNVDFPGAIAAFVDRQRTFIDQNDHSWLCLHKTASGGSAQDIAHFFATNADMHSTHYVVGQDGAIVQCVQEVDGAGGNCCLETGHAAFLPLGVNLNVKTISIEHVDPASDNSTPLTQAQKAASFRLIKDICRRHNIPMRRGDSAGGIIGHHDIAPLSRARCPGNYPWDELFAFLQEDDMPIRVDLNTPGLSNFFTQSGNGWLCKQTGKLVHGAILDMYQQRGWNADWGLPKSNETPIQTFPEFAHLAGKGIVVQWFERMAAAYDPEHLLPGEPPPNSGAVYPLQLFGEGPGIDPRLRSTRAELVAAQAEVAQLKAQPAPVVDSRVGKFEQIKAIATS